MSHDRDCHCGRESYEYNECPLEGCMKRPGPDPVASVMKKKPKAATTNPKTLVGQKKVSMTCVPASGQIHMARAMMDGVRKYGKMNYRDTPVEASIYIDAAYRHLMSWYDGEEVAEDSGVHHLGHVMACMAIVLDAMENGTLIDDRPSKGNAAEILKRFTEKYSDPDKG